MQSLNCCKEKQLPSQIGNLPLTSTTQSVDQNMSQKRIENSGNDKEKLRKAAQDFESIFLDLVLKSMRSTVEKSGYMDGGNAEEIYRSLLDSEYAKIMAATNTTGLSDAIVKQFDKSIKPQKVIESYLSNKIE